MLILLDMPKICCIIQELNSCNLIAMKKKLNKANG